MLSFAQIFGRAACVAAALTTVISLGGCAAWKADRWNIDSLRDQRAVEVDQRLSRDRTIVENPFR